MEKLSQIKPRDEKNKKEDPSKYTFGVVLYQGERDPPNDKKRSINIPRDLFPNLQGVHIASLEFTSEWERGNLSTTDSIPLLSNVAPILVYEKDEEISGVE